MANTVQPGQLASVTLNVLAAVLVTVVREAVVLEAVVTETPDDSALELRNVTITGAEPVVTADEGDVTEVRAGVVPSREVDLTTESESCKDEGASSVAAATEDEAGSPGTVTTRVAPATAAGSGATEDETADVVDAEVANVQPPSDSTSAHSSVGAEARLIRIELSYTSTAPEPGRHRVITSSSRGAAPERETIGTRYSPNRARSTATPTTDRGDH